LQQNHSTYVKLRLLPLAYDPKLIIESYGYRLEEVQVKVSERQH